MFGNADDESDRTVEIVRFPDGSKSFLKQVTAESLNDFVNRSEGDLLEFHHEVLPLSMSNTDTAISRFNVQSDLAAVLIMNSTPGDPIVH